MLITQKRSQKYKFISELHQIKKKRWIYYYRSPQHITVHYSDENSKAYVVCMAY